MNEKQCEILSGVEDNVKYELFVLKGMKKRGWGTWHCQLFQVLSQNISSLGLRQ